jgi:hypothetical protein
MDVPLDLQLWPTITHVVMFVVGYLLDIGDD